MGLSVVFKVSCTEANAEKTATAYNIRTEQLFFMNTYFQTKVKQYFQKFFRTFAPLNKIKKLDKNREWTINIHLDPYDDFKINEHQK